jgi:hypothetical protein
MTKTFLRCLGVGILLFQSNRVEAQPYVDVLNLRYQQFPKVKCGTDTGKVRIDEYCLSATLPIVLKNKNVIIAGACYDQLDFSFSQPSQKKTLYCMNLQLGYLHHWKSEKYKLMVLAIPKLAADRFVLNSHTFQQAGLAMFTYKRREHLSYKLGFYFSPEFFGNFYMPLIGLEWRPSPRLTLYGFVPASANVEYQCNKKCYAGFSYINLTQSYRITGTQMYVRNGDVFWGNMHMKLFLNYYVKKNYVLYTELGYTLWRSYNSYHNAAGQEATTVFQQARNGPIFNVGIALRVRTD